MVAHLGIEGIEDAEQIGSGGNAVVYRAREVAHDRWVAVKVLRQADDDSRRRFDRERRAMGRLSDHEGIVTIHRSGLNADGDPFIVMSLYEHGSLQDHIDRTGPMPWQQAATMAAEIAATVAAAHREGVVHRDLKPGNVLLSGSGRPVVADFGISRFVGPTASLASVAMTFSPAFSPPEVMEGAEPSASADIYGIGATLFTLLRGQPPFLTGGDESIYGVMYRVANDPPEDLRAMGVPDELWGIVQRLMAKAPEDRPADAGAVAEELRALAAPTASGPPVATPEGAAPRRGVGRTVAAVLGIAAVLGVVGGLVWALAGGDDEPEDVVTATPTADSSPTAAAEGLGSEGTNEVDEYVELIRANEAEIFGWLSDAAARTVEINDRTGAAQVPACIGASTELAPTATGDLLPVVDQIPDGTAGSALRNAIEAYLRAFDECAAQSPEGYIGALEDASAALTRFCDRNAELNQAVSGDAGVSGCALVVAGED